MKTAITILTLTLFAACAGTKQTPVVAHDNETRAPAGTDGDKVQPLDSAVDR